MQAFDDLRDAAAFESVIRLYAREVSRGTDLSKLVGITVAADYAGALARLDRGTAAARIPTPSEGDVVGIAMTAGVIREGVAMSHIVFNASYIWPLALPSHELFAQALNTFAHECAHVEVNAVFDAAFPDVCSGARAPSLRVATRWDCIMGCWDDYAVTRVTADIGKDPSEAYEAIFLGALQDARPTVNSSIEAFRVHRNPVRMFQKHAAYHLGNSDGFNRQAAQQPRTRLALEEHAWFVPHFERLAQCCRTLFEQYGRWGSKEDFEAIGNLLEEVLLESGIRLQDGEAGGLRIHVAGC